MARLGGYSVRYQILMVNGKKHGTGELGYDRLNGTRKIGLSYAKSVVYI